MSRKKDLLKDFAKETLKNQTTANASAAAPAADAYLNALKKTLYAPTEATAGATPWIQNLQRESPALAGLAGNVMAHVRKGNLTDQDKRYYTYWATSPAAYTSGLYGTEDGAYNYDTSKNAYLFQQMLRKQLQPYGAFDLQENLWDRNTVSMVSDDYLEKGKYIADIAAGMAKHADELNAQRQAQYEEMWQPQIMQYQSIARNMAGQMAANPRAAFDFYNEANAGEGYDMLYNYGMLMRGSEYMQGKGIKEPYDLTSDEHADVVEELLADINSEDYATRVGAEVGMKTNNQDKYNARQAIINAEYDRRSNYRNYLAGDVNSVLADPEYNTLSQYNREMQPGDTGWSTGFNDADYHLYNYINNPGLYLGNERVDSDSKILEMGSYRDMGLNALTAEEKGIFNALWAKYGPEKAKQYIEYLKPVLPQRNAEMDNQAIAAASTGDYGFAMWLAASGLKLVDDTVMVVPHLIDQFDGEVDPYSQAYALSRFTESVRGSQGAMIEDVAGEDLGPYARFAYDTGNAISDEVAKYLATWGIGTAAGWGAKGMSALQSAISASAGMNQTFYQEAKKGNAGWGVIGKAALVAGAEFATEKIGFDALIADPKSTLGHIARNFAAEGMEEYASEWLGVGADELAAWISGHKSELSAMREDMLAKYGDQMTPQEIDRQIITGLFENANRAGLIGGVTGGVIGGGYAGTQARQTEAEGKHVMAEGDVRQLAEIGMGMPVSSESYKAALAITQIYQAAGEDGDANPTPKQVGKLAQALAQDLPAEYQDVVTDVTAQAVEGRLAELGETGDTKAIARAIAANLTNREMTRQQMQMIRNSSAAMQAINEYNGVRVADGKIVADAEAGVDESFSLMAPAETAEVDENVPLDAYDASLPAQIEALEGENPEAAIADALTIADEGDGQEAAQALAAAYGAEETAQMLRNALEIANGMRGITTDELKAAVVHATRAEGAAAEAVAKMADNGVTAARVRALVEAYYQDTTEIGRERAEETGTVTEDGKAKQEAAPSWVEGAKLAQAAAGIAAKSKVQQYREAAGQIKKTQKATDVITQEVKAAAEKAKKLAPVPGADVGKDAVSVDVDGEEIVGSFVRFEKGSNGDASVVIKDASGERTVSVEDVISAGDEGLRNVAAYIASAPQRVSATEANTMLKVYQMTGGSIQEVMQDFESAYSAGYSGDVMPAVKLSEGAAKVAYEEGKRNAEADEARRLERATAFRAAETGSVTWLGEVTTNEQVRGRGGQEALSGAMESMTESQRATAEAIQAIAEAAKINIVLFQSASESIAEMQNGSYDQATHTIYLDINAGANTAGGIEYGKESGTLGYAMMRTLSHELTHHIESTSPEGYAKLRTAMRRQMAEQGVNWSWLVHSKMLTAGRNGQRLTRAGAESEVIADACEYMLQNSDLVKRLDKGLREKVRDFVSGFLQKVKNAFRHITGGHFESGELRKQVDGVMQYVGDLQQIWDVALEEATGGYQIEEAVLAEQEGQAQMTAVAEAEAQEAGFVTQTMETAYDMQDVNGQKLFSLRSFQEDYDTYRMMLADHGMDVREIDALFDTIDQVMKDIEANRDILDFGWNVGREDRSFSPVKQNSDSLYKVSIDFSTLCRKRLLQQTVQERLEAMYDTVLTKAERVAIRNELMKLREAGKQIEVACALCYVESTRLKSPAQIQRFFDDRRAVMVDYFAKKNKAYMAMVNARADEEIVKLGNTPGTKKKELNSQQKKKIEALKQGLYKTYQPTAEEEAIIREAVELPGDSYKTDKGLWALKKEHPEIFDAYTSFVRNATKSKGIEGDEAWWAGDSKSISDSLIEQMNAENGLRSQSWSDFQVIHLLDYISAIIELSTRGAKMQTYTKVPDFVKLMGDTGAMINLSLIPKGFDGTLNYDPIEGMPIETALALREAFPNTCGTICIGITDEHIRMLLDDPDTDYVIPYHSSSLDKKTRQQMGMKVWDDFQRFQTEKERDYANTVKDNATYHKHPRFSEWYDYETVAGWAQDVGAERAMQMAADRYIDLCHRRGLQEKFPQFAMEPGYWKLLIDRKMINQKTGAIIKQEAVQPRFDLDRIREILRDEVNRFKEQNRDKDEAVRHIEKAWENGDIRKAAKSKKVQDAVSAFNATVLVRNIVESAQEVESKPDVQQSARDLPDEATVRGFIGDAGEAVAATVEERNAVEIYQKKLKDHQEASAEVEAAETALKAMRQMEKAAQTTQDRKDARERVEEGKKRLDLARIKQRKLYNALIKLEDTPYISQVMAWTRGFIANDLAGTEDEIRERMEQAVRDLEELTEQVGGLEAASRAQAASETKRRVEQQRRLVSAYTSEAKEKLMKQRDEFRSREAKAREYRSTRDEVMKLRRQIGRSVKRLNTLRVQETDAKHVPQELQALVDEVMKTFTDTALSSLAFPAARAASLSRTYSLMRDLESDTAFVWDDEVQEMLNGLSELSEEYTAIKAQDAERGPSLNTLEGAKMQQELLNGVNAIVSNVMRMVTSRNEAFLQGRKESFEDYAAMTGRALEARKDAKVLKGAAGEAQSMLDDMLVKGNMTPIYYIEHLNNEYIKAAFDEVRDGIRKAAMIEAEGKSFVQQAKAKYHYGKWAGDKSLKFKTEQGHEIELTREQALWAYATAKREKSNELYQTEHLSRGGFQYKDTKNIGTGKWRASSGTHQLRESDMKRIEAWLTDEQKAYADAMVGFLSDDMAEYGNAAAMAMYGYEKFREKYYFPFHVSQEQVFQRGDEGAQGENAATTRIKNSGFTKKLKRKADKALVMDDFTTVVAGHIQQMSVYASMVQPIENVKRLLNHVMVADDGSSNTLRALIGQKYGKASQDYMLNLLKDLNGAVMSDRRATKGVDKLISAFKRGAVMASASVVLQQPTAMARAMAYISPKYFAKNPFIRPSKGTWDEMLKYSGSAVIKDMGKFDVGMGLTATQYIEDENLGVLQAYQRARNEGRGKALSAGGKAFMDWLTAAPGKADQWTWSIIWKAVKAEQAEQHPGMSQTSEAFLQMCGKRFDDVVDHTQVYDSVMTRSNLMRSQNALHKMATSFMSEPTLSLNMLWDALTGKHSGKKRAAIIGGVMASQVLAGAMAALVQAYNDDDDERNWLEKYADRASSNIFDNINVLNMIPYVSDIVSIFQGYDVERPDMTVIKDIIDYADTFFDKASDPDKDLTWKDYENFVGTICNMIGIPAKNISREIRRTKNAIVNTDWSTPDMSNVGYVIEENTIFGSDKNSEYYDRIVTAYLNEDDELVEDLATYMLTSKMVNEDAMATGIKKAYGERYKEGGIAKEDAVEFLVSSGYAETQKEAFETVDRWGEGADHYSAYNSVKEAMDAGTTAEVREAVKELTDNGWEQKAIADEMRAHVRAQYMAGTYDQSKAKRLYKDFCAPSDFDTADENEWYWLFKELDYGKQRGGSTQGYGKYDEFLAAAETGAGIRGIAQEYLSHGVSKSALSSALTREYKQRMIDLKDAGNMRELADLQAHILSAYEALGYDREKKLKDVREWYE